MKCEKVKLSDVCDLIAGFAFKSKDFGDFEDKVIKIADIVPPRVEMNRLRGINLSNYNKDKLEKFIAKPGDYVLAMTGATIGKIGRIYEKSAYINQRVLLFHPHKEIDKDFLYYTICAKPFYNYIINFVDSETAQPNISATTIGKYELYLPPLNTQEKIASILQLLDMKIELNNAINNNLEQQAQAVYREMFATNGVIASATIADVSLNVTDGVHNTVHDDQDGKYFLLSCKNIKGGHLSIGTNERTINEEVFSKLRRRTNLSKGDILISSVGTVGELLLLNTEPTNYEFQRSVAIVKPDPAIISAYYLYEALTCQKAELINAAHGAVQQCLFISDIAGFPIGIPAPEVLLKFNSIVAPIFDTITANEAENTTLCSIRDSLLPRLLSGELNVSGIAL